MPIHPDDRDRYPDDWPEISDRIRFGRAGGRCECEGECGLGHVGRCPWQFGQLKRGRRIVLTTAHLDHTPEHCDDENLRAMCQGCHLHYDRAHHQESRKRRLGILDLFP